MITFGDYELEEGYGWDLDEEDLLTLRACIWLVDNKATIRETANYCGYATTTLWRRIHKRCKILSPELYRSVKHQLKINKERGEFGWGRMKKQKH